MDENQPEKHVTLAINLSNLANLLLLGSKIPLCIVTGSLAIIASVLDSVLDLVVGLLLWIARRAVKNENKYKYPIGKARMQPLGIIVFAAIMGTVSLQILTQGFTEIFSPKTEPTIPPLRNGIEFKSLFVIVVMAGNILLKAALWIYCRLFENEIVQVISFIRRTHFYFLNLAAASIDSISFTSPDSKRENSLRPCCSVPRPSSS